MASLRSSASGSGSSSSVNGAEWRAALLESAHGDDDDASVHSDSDDDVDDSMHRTLPHQSLALKPQEFNNFTDTTALVDADGVDGGYRRPTENPIVRACCSLTQKVPYYIPILSWASDYQRQFFLSDLIAGLTVGVMLVPQGLIYAGLANLPPIYGLYAAFFPVLMYVIFGSSRHLSIGPEVTTSILIGKTIVAAAKLPDGADVDDDEIQLVYLVPVAMVLSLLIGLFSFFLGVVRLGFLDSILSRPILAGFINAVALTLISEQAATLLGLPHHGGDTPAEALWAAITNIQHTHLLTAMLAAFCCITMFSIGYFKSRHADNRVIQCIPDILLVVVFVTGASYVLDFQSMGVHCLVIHEQGFKAPAVPALSEFGNSFLVTSALTITLLGFVESQLVSKKFASKHNYAISANRELVALGVASIVGSFFGAYSAFGSIARTKVAESAGAKTNVTNLIAALVSLISILVILPLFQWTPKAVTSSIIFVVAVGLIEIHEAKFIWSVKGYKDLALMCAMTAITFIFGVDTGIFFAFAACLLLAVRRTTLPGVALLGRGNADDAFGSISAIERGANDIEGVLVYSLNGALYFANAEKLKDSTRRMERFGGFHVHPSEPPKPLSVNTIIFDLANLTSVDVSALEIMHEIVTYYAQEQRRVCLVAMPRKVLYKFQLAGILELVGFENLFKTIEDALAAVKDDNQSSRSYTAPAIQIGNGSSTSVSDSGGSHSIELQHDHEWLEREPV